MRRETKRFDEGDGVYRIVNRVYSDPVSPSSPNLHMAAGEFFKMLADSQDILRCELNNYETLKIYHDGNSWIAESQAKVYGR